MLVSKRTAQIIPKLNFIKSRIRRFTSLPIETNYGDDDGAGDDEFIFPIHVVDTGNSHFYWDSSDISKLYNLDASMFEKEKSFLVSNDSFKLMKTTHKDLGTMTFTILKDSSSGLWKICNISIFGSVEQDMVRKFDISVYNDFIQSLSDTFTELGVDGEESAEQLDDESSQEPAPPTSASSLLFLDPYQFVHSPHALKTRTALHEFVARTAGPGCYFRVSQPPTVMLQSQNNSMWYVQSRLSLCKADHSELTLYDVVILLVRDSDKAQTGEIKVLDSPQSSAPGVPNIICHLAIEITKDSVAKIY